MIPAPMEHLVVVGLPTLRRLLLQRAPRMQWSRRRREPPVGVVRRGDHLTLKIPGGNVVASTRVLRVDERQDGGRHLVALRLLRPVRLPLPFPVFKHDRRSWVVLGKRRSVQQQRLIALPEPTLTDLLHAVRGTYRVLPSVLDIRRSIRALTLTRPRARQGEAGMLLILVLLFSLRVPSDLSQEAAELLKGSAPGVWPLRVFGKRSEKDA